MTTELDRKRLVRLSQAILSELDAFGRGFRKSSGSAKVESTNCRVEAALSRIQAELSEARTELAQAPFVAYLRVTEDGSEQIWLISRHYVPDTSPEDPNTIYVSYLAPLGSVAAQPLGEEASIWVPAGRRTITPIERARFRSVYGSMWDAVDNHVAWTPGFASNYPSLRRLVRQLEEEISRHSQERELQAARSTGLLQAETPRVDEALGGAKGSLDGVPRSAESTVRLGVNPVESTPVPVSPTVGKKAVVTVKPSLNNIEAESLRKSRSIAERVSLRDQPLLDADQDPVFRLPVSSRMVITGAPGTGKTTVLVKRISQKTKLNFLTESEKEGVSLEQLNDLLDPSKSWVLFTPTDLLRSYLREALGRERLPATSDTVKTWSDQQRVLARDVFGVLRVGGKGRFQLVDADVLDCSSADVAVEQLADFRRFYLRRIGEELGVVRVIMEAGMQACDALKPHLRSSSVLFYLNDALPLNTEVMHLARLIAGDGSARSQPIVPTLVGIQEARAAAPKLRKSVDGALQRVLDRMIQGHPDLIRLIGGQSRNRTMERISAMVTLTGMTPVAKEWALLKRLVDAAFHPLLDAFRTWRGVIAALDNTDLGIQHLFAQLPELYAQFRSGESPGLGANEPGEGKDSKATQIRSIGPGELDLLLYEMLRQVQEVLRARPQFIWSDSGMKVLEGVKAHMRSVVAVDEAPDFSWLQLGCMYRLAHPAWRSFAMCGDVMQRVTKTGIRKWDECRAFLPELEIATLRTSYRQSRTLLQLAKLMYERSTGEGAPFESPYPDEPEPVPLAFRSSDVYGSCQWIAARIVDIYNTCGRLPSIAVFVPSEGDIEETANGLEICLAEHSIVVEACHRGKVLGVGERVRVFAIEHIKGLEFHAVFLVGFDNMYSADEDLGEKYLYLGLTRAVMFLAVTLVGPFPQPLAYIASHFREGDWAGHTPGRT